MENNSESSISSDIFITLISHFSILLTSFLQTTLLIRILGLELFGIYGIYTSSFGFGLSICMLGIDKSLAQLISNNQEKILGYFGDIFSLVIIVCFLSTIFYYFFLFFSSLYIYNDPSLMKYLQFAAFGLFSALFSTFFVAFLRGLSKMKTIATITILARLIGLIIAFFLIITFSLMGGILAYLIYYLLELIFFFPVIYQIKKNFKLEFKFGVSKNAFKLIMQHGSAYYLLSIMGMFTFWLGIAILDRIGGYHEVGIYQVGQYIFAILQQIGNSFVFVLFPKISSFNVNKSNFNADFQKFLFKILKFSFSMQLLLGIGFIVFQDLFLILFDVTEEVRGTMITFIVIAPIVFGIGFILLDTTLYGLSEFKILFIIRFAFLFSYIISAIVFTNLLGAMGLALSMLIGWTVQITISALYINRKYLTKQPITRKLSKPFIIFLFYVLLYVSSVYSLSIVPAPLNLIVCSLIFGGALIIVLGIILNHEDRKTITHFAKSLLVSVRNRMS